MSLVGDQLARVALSVLVYARTGSTALSAAAYACTYLPALLSMPLLGGLADRYPRRRVMVSCDLLRAALFGLMALPGMPLWGLLGLVLLQTCAEAPGQAARGALVRDVTHDEADYQRGTGLDEALDSIGQVCAFAAAGALLVVVRPASALLLDVGTFLLSATIVLLLVRPRPAADDGAARDRRGRARTDLRTGWRAATATACRRPVLLTWACLFATIAPEAVAAPWAATLHAGPVVVGLLFAASPAGSLVAVLLLGRASSAAARALLLPLALLSLVPLVLCGLGPPVPLALLLVLLSGIGTGFNLLARVQFVEHVDPSQRGRAFAVAATGVMVTQGLGIASTALLALVLPPAAVVGAAGGTGLLLLGLAVLLSPQPTAGRHVSGRVLALPVGRVAPRHAEGTPRPAGPVVLPSPRRPVELPAQVRA